MTVDLMTTDHLRDNQKVYLYLAGGRGIGFGLGFGVLANRGQSQYPLSEGTFTWGGAYGTLFLIDPVEGIIGILMTKIRPSGPTGIRPRFSVVLSQVVVN